MRAARSRFLSPFSTSTADAIERAQARCPAKGRPLRWAAMFLALLMAAAAPEPAPSGWEVRAADLILEWNECMAVAADEGVDASRSPDAIVAEALAACPAQEQALRKELVRNGRGAEADRIMAEGRTRARNALQRRVESVSSDPVMTATRARAACLGNRMAHKALSTDEGPASVAEAARTACSRYDDRLRAAMLGRGRSEAEADQLLGLLRGSLLEDAEYAIARSRTARQDR